MIHQRNTKEIFWWTIAKNPDRGIEKTEYIDEKKRKIKTTDYNKTKKERKLQVNNDDKAILKKLKKYIFFKFPNPRLMIIERAMNIKK